MDSIYSTTIFKAYAMKIYSIFFTNSKIEKKCTDFYFEQKEERISCE